MREYPAEFNEVLKSAYPSLASKYGIISLLIILSPFSSLPLSLFLPSPLSLSFPSSLSLSPFFSLSLPSSLSPSLPPSLSLSQGQQRSSSHSVMNMLILSRKKDKYGHFRTLYCYSVL